MDDYGPVLARLGYHKEGHTPNCIAIMLAEIAKVEAWKARWPNHCRVCGGEGLHRWRENHGDGGPSEPMAEYCGSCIGANKCPRCGAIYEEKFYPLVDDNDIEHVCISCKWDWGRGSEDICPGGYECYGECNQEQYEDYDGQDRENYTDDQDRENYSTGPEGQDE